LRLSAQENPNLLELLFADNEFIWNNWSDYFSVSVTYTEPDHLFGDPETLVDENGNPILTAANAGNYTLTFTLLDENNVMWKDETVTPKQIALEVKPFEIKVTGWGSNHQPTSTSGFDIKYRVRIKVKEEYAGNVTLSYGEGVDEVHEFTNKNQLPPNTTKVNIPTLTTKELTFNGSEQSIEVKGFTEVSKQVIEVYVTEGGEYADGVLRFKNAGEYTVTMKIKDESDGDVHGECIEGADRSELGAEEQEGSAEAVGAGRLGCGSVRGIDRVRVYGRGREEVVAGRTEHWRRI